MVYTSPQLVDLLERQHQSRNQSGLFKKDKFTLQWRGKVGSFPYPDLETIVSAGEPCGSWRWRPQDFGQLGERRTSLPLNGYIPGSSIRGIVRAWAQQRPDIASQMQVLLGNQQDDTITSGKFEFLDAWPQEAQKLSLDIVNPQQEFQVFHEGQGKPLSFYTLGNGLDPIDIIVAIRGIPGRATEAEVEQVWDWVQQALSLYGIGSRTASGYGALVTAEVKKPKPDPEWSAKELTFTLYSQGCFGANTNEPELRPSHWRGWLRSWVWRFLLGVMSKEDAQKTLGELLGTLEGVDGRSQKGCVRLQMHKGSTWREKSAAPTFYTWKGKLVLSAPKEILNKILIPILRIAVMTGGVGRGWRRPLHIFTMNNGREAARGSHLRLTHQVKNPETGQFSSKPFGWALKTESWQKLYQDWSEAVKSQWPRRWAPGNVGLKAEIFSPQTCAVYLVPGPSEEPVDAEEQDWQITEPVDTRGEGMHLIYEPQYKRKIDVGGDAAGGGNAHCSWASIKRITGKKSEDCQEVVCLFMGNRSELRSQFLSDLADIAGSVHLFGVRANH